MANRQDNQGRPRRIRGIRLNTAGVLVLAAAGGIAAGALGTACSSRPEPPDMPPFQGTEAFLDEQARIHRAAAADEAFRERYNLGDPEVMELRARHYLADRALVEERARQIERARQRERERHERERAEEGRRRFAELEQARQYREDMRREREKAAEGQMRFEQIRRANQYREDLRRQEEREAEGKRRFADTQFLNETQHRDAARQEQQRKDQGRQSFNQVQARGS